MSFISGIRERLSDAVHDAEKAASEVASRAKETVSNAASAVQNKARAAVADAPAPSAASETHASEAAAEAARNAPKPTSAKKAEPAVFIGTGVSAAAGTDRGLGGQASAGYVIGSHGTLRTYGTTGVVNGAMGATAGAGIEVGVVGNVADMYGPGYQITLDVGVVAFNAGFGADKSLSSVSVSTGKSTGGGIFQFDTRTEDTTGR